MDGYVVKCAGTGLQVLFSQLANNSECSIEFIDPLCTMIKLAALALKPNGTKISIHDNIISIQDPGNFQGVIRWLNSDERQQLHQLRLPLFYFRGLELGHINIENFQIDQKMLTIINQHASKGLIKLKSTYETAKKMGSMVKNCLDDYIKTLAHPYTQTEYNRELSLLDKPTLFVIYNEFMKKWSVTDFNIVIQLFTLAFSKDSDFVKNEIANSINYLIISKDLEIDSLRPD